MTRRRGSCNLAVKTSPLCVPWTVSPSIPGETGAVFAELFGAVVLKLSRGGGGGQTGPRSGPSCPCIARGTKPHFPGHSSIFQAEASSTPDSAPSFISCPSFSPQLHTEILTFPFFLLIHSFIQNTFTGTSLAVQWLGLRLPMQGVWVRSLVGEIRSHMPHGQKTKT